VNEALRDELLEMSARDRQARLELPPRDAPEFPAARDALLAMDARHTARLEHLLEVHGWFGFGLVGRDGAQAAWLIAQHADGNRAFQRRFLAAMPDAVSRGDADAQQLAFLTDRVCIGSGQAQVYGTQLRVTESRLEPFEIEDMARVDERRAALGLEPLEVYLAGMKR
jgi:hypothetical protein